MKEKMVLVLQQNTIYRSVFIPIPKKRQCQRMCQTFALISHARKVMLKMLQARLQQYVNFQMFKLDLEKAEGPEIKLPTSTESEKKQENSRKTSASLTKLKPLIVSITTNCGNS